MARLGAKERDAVILRFFEGKSLKEIGTALGARLTHDWTTWLGRPVDWNPAAPP
jgi:hypothetical protein